MSKINNIIFFVVVIIIIVPIFFLANRNFGVTQESTPAPASQGDITESEDDQERSNVDDTNSEETLTAYEVGELLHSKGLPFMDLGYPYPSGTYITEGSRISTYEMNQGLLSKARAASEHGDDIFDWHIRVYGSISERNNARQEMVRDCPGCAFLTECGPILIYIPDVTRDERKRDMTRQAYEVLRDNLQCE